MFFLKKWDETVNLSKFYQQCKERGYYNNDNRKMLIDSLLNTNDFTLWLLYYNDQIVGCSGSHQLEHEDNAYRICARNAVLSTLIPNIVPFNKHIITKHQNSTSQIFIKNFIEQLPNDAKLYITSNSSSVGSQEKVHRLYCPMLSTQGVLENCGVRHYRGHDQIFWKVRKRRFLENLIEVNQELDSKKWRYRVI